MKRYRRLVRQTGANWAPLGATVNRKLSTAQVTKSIINCFGLPTVTGDTAIETLKANVWSTLGSDIQLALSEVFHLIGVACSGLAMGAPVWLLTGSINSSHIVPTTCRLFLIMSCDLTLVLARAFKEVTFRAQGQPNEKDVSAAARNYAVRGYSNHVHQDIKRLIPRKSPMASLRVDAVQQGLENVLIRYKDGLMEDVDLPLQTDGMSFMRIDSKLSDDTSTEADSVMFADARAALVELEATSSRQTSIAELDGSPTVTELPANDLGRTLSNAKLTTIQEELEGSVSFSESIFTRLRQLQLLEEDGLDIKV